MFRLPKSALAAIAVLGLMQAHDSRAAPIISASVGGAPVGTILENFDSLSLGNGGGTTPTGIGVAFTGNAQLVTGDASGVYAAPFLSGGNGAGFGSPGNQPNGADTTRYLTTGTSTVTLTLPSLVPFVGLLWGSVDTYNTLQLFNGAVLVDTIGGAQVSAIANGNQGLNGTFYVNITASGLFDTVVASSSSFAFEFDNVAFGRPSAVPAPAAFGLFGLALLGMGLVRRRA